MSLFDNLLYLDEYEKILKNLVPGAINQVNEHNRTALFYTDLAHSKLLIENGIDINHADNHGQNALFHSLYWQDYDTAKLLISSGIDIHHVRSDGKNALFWADYETAKLLIENGIDTECVSNRGICVVDVVEDPVKELILHAPVKSNSKSARKR